MGDEFRDAQEEEEFDPTLQNVVESRTLRWVFVGGKGGVGKTTTACALAIEFAKVRDSVLLLSTDPAHNISDAFKQKFSNTPVQVDGFENLFAMEIDASYTENVEFRLKKDEGFGKFMQELVTAFPGADEAVSFAELMQSVERMTYSVIVFDTAPTGHTLRLLAFPTLLEKGLGKLSALKSKFGGAMEMMRSLSDQDVREEDMYGRVDALRENALSVRRIFQDPTLCTFVCVAIPEFLSVYETERLVQELATHKIDTCNIVVNQVLMAEDCGALPAQGGAAPFSAENVTAEELERVAEDVRSGKREFGKEELSELLKGLASRTRRLEKADEMCTARRRVQGKYLDQISELYGFDFHVVQMPLQLEEVRGAERLQQFARGLLGQGGGGAVSGATPAKAPGR